MKIGKWIDLWGKDYAREFFFSLYLVVSKRSNKCVDDGRRRDLSLLNLPMEHTFQLSLNATSFSILATEREREATLTASGINAS